MSHYVIQEDEKKTTGAHYTPEELAMFVAKQIVDTYDFNGKRKLNILDPAAGDGILLYALSKLLHNQNIPFDIYGFDTNKNAVEYAYKFLSSWNQNVFISEVDFLEHIFDNYVQFENSLFKRNEIIKYDLVISNPPYIRTQHLGAEKSQELAKRFQLKGRVDIYYPFICGISECLQEGGIAGIIISNRFMTTKAGQSLRERIIKDFEVIHVWDMGDTKFFDAAVLPSVLVLRKKSIKKREYLEATRFTSIYSYYGVSHVNVDDITEALRYDGAVNINGKGCYIVKNGTLQYSDSEDNIWRFCNSHVAAWLEKISKNTYCYFKDVGKIRVGIKTTADKIYIRNNWEESVTEIPELLAPLTTHHIAQSYKPLDVQYHVLYTHTTNKEGKREAIDLSKYPFSLKYLLKYKKELSSRKYILEAGRNWFEIWVPHDPDIWKREKIVFRDIVEKPMFWLDDKGTIVNGDCYWLTYDYASNKDLLWLLLAVGNSSFIVNYYDTMFHNKLYSNRRRFMTQYVNKFPLPNPNTKIAQDIIANVKQVYYHGNIELCDSIDSSVWQAFGLEPKETIG